MKVLHVITTVNPDSGGPIEGLKQLAGVMAQEGHTVEVVSLDGPDAVWVAQCPVLVHALGPVRSTYAYSPRLLPWLRENASHYDAVIARGIWQYGSFATWRALRHSKTPYLVFTHGMLDPWFKHSYPLKHLKKCLYWPWGEYRVLRDAAGVCFTCEEERLLARQSFRPYKCREFVVSYGTAGARGDREKQKQLFFDTFPQLSGKRVLLFISRIHVKKGCDLLIEAFAQIASLDPDLHLVMAGPDQTHWRAALEAQAERLGITSCMTWTGMLSGDLKWGAFRAAEVFVLPSHQENFGIVVAESLSCGTPVLISNKVNIWREIEKDGAGFVDEDTVEGTIRVLERWLNSTPTEQTQMSEQARHCFLQRFEIHGAADSLLRVLDEVCSSNQNAARAGTVE